jgi:hypothetical protein
MKSYLDRLLNFGARALSEDTGQPSSRRVVMVAAIFAAIFFSAGLLIKQPAMCVDLIKYVIGTTLSLFTVTRGMEIFKERRPSGSDPAPPAAPAV